MIDNELVNIVGKENVLDQLETLEEFSGDASFAKPRTPAYIVKPGSTEELQSIIKWANRKRIGLVPLSSGGPHFRGDTVPIVDGTVVVDLRRMDKIVRINYPNRVALIEPGVTFGQLQAELAKKGLSAYLPLSPRSTKSVLSSVLERDPITMPCIHFDSTDPMLCLEIVYGTGEKMRTGEAAGPDTLDQQWEIGKAQISPFGPTQMDPQRLVSGAQGTMGIVTWMSVKCRHLSAKNSAFLISGTILEPMVELMNKLTKIRFTGNILILNGLNLACLVRQTSQEIVTLAQKLPPYVMFVSCEGYGPLPEEKVQYLEEDLKELSASFGLKPESTIENVKAEEFSALMTVPSVDPYWKLRLKDGLAELFFLTTQGKVPEFVKAMADIAQQRGYSTDDIGMYFQPVVMGTSCHCEFDFYYDPTDQAAVENTRKIVLEAADKMEAMGAFFSRPYGDWTDIAYRRCQDTVEMQKKIKGIFDPNGILNPGHLCFRQTTG